MLVISRAYLVRITAGLAILSTPVTAFSQDLPPKALARTFKLNAEETPGSTPWAEPAYLSFTSGDGKSSKQVNVATQFQRQLHNDTDSLLFIGVTAKVNDESKSEQEFYKVKLGLHDEHGYGSNNSRRVMMDWGVSYQQKTIFEKPDLPQCALTPLADFCSDQHETSLRLSLNTEFYKFNWNNAPSLHKNDDELAFVKGKSFAYGFSPVVTVFSDQVLAATTDPDTGNKVDGNASGAALSLTGGFTPPIFDYRFDVKASYKYTQTLSLDKARAASFPKHSDLVKISLDYNFGPSPYLETGLAWRPAIGISYSSGADPLSGRKEKEETVIAFKLAYSK